MNEKNIQNLTSINPIAAGDMFGSPNDIFIANAKIIGGSFISGPTSANRQKFGK